jgi:3-dehydrotetronate 4-kinase
VLIYSTATPDAVRAVQQHLGVHDAGTLVEQALAAIGRGLVAGGVRQLVVAGGETSGAVVQALGVQQMRIGPQIDPGVPWCHATATACDAQLHLALKSGNFGSADFFHKSFKVLA